MQPLHPSTESVCADETLMRGVLATLQDRIGPQKYNAWFRHGAKIELLDGHIRVSVPNPFVANWMEQHYREDLVAAVETHTQRTCPVVVSVDSQLCKQTKRRALDLQAEMVSRVTQGRARPRKPEARPGITHQLSEFVVGPSNRLAYQAALSAATGVSQFSQLFLHGPCGVGKTHLLQGICDAAAKRAGADGRPMATRYVTGEQFTNEFIVAIRNKQGAEFRQRYRKLDMLVIDDVHFLAAKRATQDEFLHTFNAIQTAGKQVILASDAHPRMVGKLNEQLVTRFMAGMVVKVDAPDKATRAEILRRKAAALKLDLPTDVQDYVSGHITGSVRELEGAVLKLSALAGLENQPLTLELARDALADDLARTDSAVTLGDIEAIVAAYFGVTPADIQSSRRTKTVSAARALCMFLARRHTRMSFPEIGRFMGKNHSSCVLACQRVEKLLADNGVIAWDTSTGRTSMPAVELLALLEEQIG